MTSLVARTVPVHNMHTTPMNYDSFNHLNPSNLNGTQEFFYPKESTTGLLAEVRQFQDSQCDPDGSTRYGNDSKRKRTREEEASPTKLQEDVFTPPQSKCGRLQIEVPGKDISLVQATFVISLLDSRAEFKTPAICNALWVKNA